ncbi:MAG: hypothetical protein ACP5K1_03060 [Candidatus Bathyarchaeia archaeon]
MNEAGNHTALNNIVQALMSPAIMRGTFHKLLPWTSGGGRLSISPSALLEPFGG